MKNNSQIPVRIRRGVFGSFVRMSQPLTYDTDDPLAVWDGPYLWDDETTTNTNNTMADINVSFSVEEVLGFCQGTTDMVKGYKTQMVAKGIDPTAQLTLLGTAQTSLSAENVVQEGLKTQLRDQTTVVEASRNKAYTAASNLCDQVVTAFGKTSEQAQEAVNLRKKLRPARSAAAAAKAAQKAKTA
jgi:hypothetical protein